MADDANVQVTNPVEGAQTPAGTEGTQPANWYDGLDLSDEYKGLIQTKNFKTINDFVKSYQNIEKMTGVDKNEIIRIPKPKDGEEPDYTDVFKALGRPEKYSDYGLPDNDFANKVAEEMFRLGLSTKQAKGIADFVDKYAQENGDAANKANEEKLEAAAKEARESLKKDWGKDFDLNIEVAKQAVADLKDTIGLDPDVLDKLGDVIGVDKAAKLFYLLGKDAASDGSKNLADYVSKSGAETPEIAKYKLSELYADPEIAKKLAAHDPAVTKELNRLNKIVAEASFKK